MYFTPGLSILLMGTQHNVFLIVHHPDKLNRYHKTYCITLYKRFGKIHNLGTFESAFHLCTGRLVQEIYFTLGKFYQTVYFTGFIVNQLNALRINERNLTFTIWFYLHAFNSTIYFCADPTYAEDQKPSCDKKCDYYYLSITFKVQYQTSFFHQRTQALPKYYGCIVGHH